MDLQTGRGCPACAYPLLYTVSFAVPGHVFFAREPPIPRHFGLGVGGKTDDNGVCVFDLGGNNYNVIAISELDSSRDEKIVSVRENDETHIDLGF